MYATNEMLTFFENFCKRGIIIVGIAVVSPMPGNEVVKTACNFFGFYGVARHMQKKPFKTPFFRALMIVIMKSDCFDKNFIDNNTFIT